MLFRYLTTPMYDHPDAVGATGCARAEDDAGDFQRRRRRYVEHDVRQPPAVQDTQRHRPRQDGADQGPGIIIYVLCSL